MTTDELHGRLKAEADENQALLVRVLWAVSAALVVNLAFTAYVAWRLYRGVTAALG